jgi:hypothetical protein
VVRVVRRDLAAGVRFTVAVAVAPEALDDPAQPVLARGDCVLRCAVCAVRHFEGGGIHRAAVADGGLILARLLVERWRRSVQGPIGLDWHVG